ncbi:restriction endonuclease subunit S, partial [Autumnicola musiva]
EFPNDEGEPYKSSGGKMVYNEELDKEIPERWVVKHLGDISNCLDNRRKPLSKEERAVRQGTVPYYGAMSIVDYIDDYIYDGDYLLFSEDGANIIDENGYPALQYVSGKFWLNNHSHILEGTKEISIQFLFNALSKINVSDIVTGAAQPKINQHNMNSIRILTATTLIHQNFNKLVISGYELVKYNIKEIHLLTVLQAVLLSKMSLVEENKLSKMNMVL